MEVMVMLRLSSFRLCMSVCPLDLTNGAFKSALEPYVVVENDE